MKLTFARAAPQAARVSVDELQRRRIEIARAHPIWREVEADFVQRGPRLLVSAGSDEVYAPFLASVFHNGSANSLQDSVALVFTVDDRGTLRFYERVGRTWSEIMARQAHRSTRAR